MESDSVLFKTDGRMEKLTGCDTIVIAEAMAAVRDAKNLLKSYGGAVRGAATPEPPVT